MLLDFRYLSVVIDRDCDVQYGRKALLGRDVSVSSCAAPSQTYAWEPSTSGSALDIASVH